MIAYNFHQFFRAFEALCEVLRSKCVDRQTMAFYDQILNMNTSGVWATYSPLEKQRHLKSLENDMMGQPGKALTFADMLAESGQGNVLSAFLSRLEDAIAAAQRDAALSNDKSLILDDNICSGSVTPLKSADKDVYDALESMNFRSQPGHDAGAAGIFMLDLFERGRWVNLPLEGKLFSLSLFDTQRTQDGLMKSQEGRHLKASLDIMRASLNHQPMGEKPL